MYSMSNLIKLMYGFMYEYVFNCDLVKDQDISVFL